MRSAYVTRGLCVVPPRSAAFTLIELLVVIGIIALLIAILFPVLGRSRDRAKCTIELAAARTLAQAYTGRSIDRNGEVLVGYTDEENGYDQYGNVLSGEPAYRWPWRLIEYLDHQYLGSILVNDQAEALGEPSGGAVTFWQYAVSVEPSFGLNYHNLGGNEISPINNMPGLVTRIEDAVKPSELIVFASARSYDLLNNQTVHGYFRITSPNDSVLTYQWPDVPYTYEGAPEQTGNVDPRCDDTAVVSHVDGSATFLGVDLLRDMTRWNNTAAAVGDPDWTP